MGVEDEGDRAIMECVDMHFGGEDSRGWRAANDSGHPFDKFIVEGFCLLRLGGLIEGWAGSLAQIPVEGELADDKHLEIQIDEAFVHPAVFVFEAADGGNFFNKPIQVFACIDFFNAKKNEQAFADCADGLLVDRDGCSLDSLDDGTHGSGTKYEGLRTKGKTVLKEGNY